MTALLEGSSPVLTCFSYDTSRDIEWVKRDPTQGEIELELPVFAKDGLRGVSTLTVQGILLEHAGDYVCRVGRTESTVTINVSTMSTGM